MRRVNPGLLPAGGGGLTSLAATGQTGRLIDYYFHAYLKAFEHLYYFSYHKETLSNFSDEPAIADGVSLVPRLRHSPYRVYAFQLPFVAQRPRPRQPCRVRTRPSCDAGFRRFPVQSYGWGH